MKEEKQISKLEKYLTIAGKGIAIIMAAYGGYKFIYGLGFEGANKENNSARIEKNVNLLLKSDTLKTKQYAELLIIVTGHLKSNKLQDSSFDALTKSVKALAQVVAKTPAEYVRLLEGKSFEVIQDEPMKSVFPSPKVRIHKVPKDSIK
jgi:hypothetical protein